MYKTNLMPTLQTKSASGAVASFNTALAMPLASCNIAVNAWQEGSGDPSPSNVRPIHGWTECNGYQRGINLWDEQYQLGSYATSNGAYVSRTDRLCTLNKIPVSPNTTYYFKTATGITAGNVYYYDINEDYLYNDAARGNNTFTTPSNCHFINIAFGLDYGVVYNNDISINYPSTDTSYHPYDSNSTTYTIQLGQEVYGAEVDAVNGVAHVTHGLADLGDYNWTKRANTTGLFFTRMPEIGGLAGEKIVLCSDYKVEYIQSFNSTVNLTINDTTQLYANCVGVKNDDYDSYTEAEFKAAMTGVKVVYQLLTPFDIQLTPTQIETLIGNNTIFADTGDVDLTYKDLDIAKRGNFREVFRLPS